ncbi:hypothetical protein [Sphaerisporangium rhizosphaerae]|uniref:ABC transporter permease n=1 Tax=Sphaerisporangium rhizosphaerae TaxID=2269375 RepID=A0ABW2PCM7_9ACTN
MIARRLAGAALRLFPRAWLHRYGDEMRDLLATRPVRLETLADLCTAAIDAWAHRDLIPRRYDARPNVVRRLLPPPLLAAAGCGLLAILWDSAVKFPSGGEPVWRSAVEHGALATTLLRTASSLFGLATIVVLLAQASALVVAARLRRPTTAMIGGLLGFAMAAITYLYYGLPPVQEYGMPLGPMLPLTGGFVVPMILSLALAGRAAALSDDVPATALRWTVAGFAASAALTVAGWVPATAFLLLGAEAARPGYVAVMTASIACSLLMCVGLTLTAIRRRPRPVPVG